MNLLNGLKYFPEMLEAWANEKQIEHFSPQDNEWKLELSPLWIQQEKYRIAPTLGLSELKLCKYLNVDILVRKRFKFLATDSNGTVFAYEKEPRIYDSHKYWNEESAESVLVTEAKCGLWKQSLRSV